MRARLKRIQLLDSSMRENKDIINLKVMLINIEI